MVFGVLPESVSNPSLIFQNPGNVRPVSEMRGVALSVRIRFGLLV